MEENEGEVDSEEVSYELARENSLKKISAWNSAAQAFKPPAIVPQFSPRKSMPIQKGIMEEENEQEEQLAEKWRRQ